jgi:type II secretory pathway component PulM
MGAPQEVETVVTIPSASAIVDRLAELRRRLQLWLLIDGFSRLLTAAVGLAAFDFLLDWRYEMDRPQRAVVLGLSLSALAVVAYRRLWQPLTTSATDAALALKIEQRHPKVHERLISALELARLDHPPAGASPHLIAAVSSGTRGFWRLPSPSLPA